MPKSKRDRVVSLTKTKGRGFEKKEKVVEEIKKCCTNFSSIYIFSISNMRNKLLKHVRQDWKSSRFFFDKNTVMQIALGKSRADEALENLHQLAKRLVGERGLFFTNENHDSVENFFSSFVKHDFCRQGNTVNQDVKIDAGIQPQFQHTMEPYLRKLGLPVSLRMGTINLDEDYVLCKKGDVLTSNQSKLLELFGVPLADFKVKLLFRYNDGKVAKLTNDDDGGSEDDDEDMSDGDDDEDEEEEEEEEEIKPKPKATKRK